MTVLITGGLGFIGSHVTRDFLENGHQVVATRFGTDQVASFLEPHLGKELVVEPLDIASPHATIDVCRRNKIKSIVHIAGPQIGAIAAIEEFRINMMGMLNIMEAARIVGASRVSIASSYAVYMGLEGPLVEDMLVRLDPAHPIEAFKKADELLGKYLGADSGIDFVSLRFASIYGPRYRTLRHLPAQFVHAAVSGRAAPLEIPGLPKFYGGDHATDLCYAPDCAVGIRLVHTSNQVRHKSYNIGTGRNLVNQDVADAARSVFPNLEIRLEPGVGPENWPNATLDVTRLKEDTGFQPRFTLEQALEDYAKWLRDGNDY